MRYARCPECHRNRLVVTLRGRRKGLFVFRRHRLPEPHAHLHERYKNELCAWSMRRLPPDAKVSAVPA